jgi:hypothetical protein
VPIFSFESGELLDVQSLGRSSQVEFFGNGDEERRRRSSIDPISVDVTSICRRRVWVRLLPDERPDS